MRWLLMVVILGLTLSACQVFGGGDDNSGAARSQAEPSVITWERSPDSVIFRMDVVGGDDEDAFYQRSEIPLCTIYGDGRVVWATGSYEDGTRVLFDRLQDTQIRRFVDMLVNYWELYRHNAGLDLVISQTRPVVEQITLTVNGQTHITDALSGWDYGYFAEILDACVTLGETPTVFEPQGGWVSAQQTTFNSRAPVNGWDSDAAGVDFAVLAESGQRQWVSGQVLRVLWYWLNNTPPTLQFSQRGGVFIVALEIPNVTRDSPPAPQD